MRAMEVVGVVSALIPVAYRVSAYIVGFAKEVHDARNTFNAFAAEISGLGHILEAATTSLSAESSPLRGALPSDPAAADISQALSGALENIRLYLDELQKQVQDIQGSEDDPGAYRRAIQTFLLRVHKDRVASLRSLLQTHLSSVNTALLMLSIHQQAQRPPSEYVDLRPDIYRLAYLIQRLPTGADLRQLSNELAADRVRKVRRVAEGVAHGASLAAASSRASEAGAPLDDDSRRRIDEWLDRRLPTTDSVLDDLAGDGSRALANQRPTESRSTPGSGKRAPASIMTESSPADQQDGIRLSGLPPGSELNGEGVQRQPGSQSDASRYEPSTTASAAPPAKYPSGVVPLAGVDRDGSTPAPDAKPLTIIRGLLLRFQSEIDAYFTWLMIIVLFSMLSFGVAILVIAGSNFYNPCFGYYHDMGDCTLQGFRLPTGVLTIIFSVVLALWLRRTRAWCITNLFLEGVLL